MNGLGGGLHRDTGRGKAPPGKLSFLNLQPWRRILGIIKSHSPDIHTSFIIWNEQKSMGVGEQKRFFSYHFLPHHLSKKVFTSSPPNFLLHNPYQLIHGSPNKGLFEASEVNKKWSGGQKDLCISSNESIIFYKKFWSFSPIASPTILEG